MAVRILLEDAHLKPSPRLLVGVAVLAALSTSVLVVLAGRWAFWLLPLWGGPMGWAYAYISGSWIRISATKGISWCLATRGLARVRSIGSIELLPSEIAELRLESTLLARLLGLWDLQIVKRDGTVLPKFRFFAGMDRQAEILHGYLEQLGRP